MIISSAHSLYSLFRFQIVQRLVVCPTQKQAKKLFCLPWSVIVRIVFPMRRSDLEKFSSSWWDFEQWMLMTWNSCSFQKFCIIHPLPVWLETNLSAAYLILLCRPTRRQAWKVISKHTNTKTIWFYLVGW